MAPALPPKSVARCCEQAALSVCKRGLVPQQSSASSSSAMSSRAYAAKKKTQHTKPKPEQVKKVPIVDTTTDEVFWYAKFKKDFCFDDENHVLLKVRRSVAFSCW